VFVKLLVDREVFVEVCVTVFVNVLEGVNVRVNVGVFILVGVLVDGIIPPYTSIASIDHSLPVLVQLCVPATIAH
jgi:hypothetical protein